MRICWNGQIAPKLEKNDFIFTCENISLIIKYESLRIALKNGRSQGLHFRKLSKGLLKEQVRFASKKLNVFEKPENRKEMLFTFFIDASYFGFFAQRYKFCCTTFHYLQLVFD